jgi:G patch domain-containing protein 1
MIRKMKVRVLHSIYTAKAKSVSTESTQAPTPIEEEDPKANAARVGMYGPLTHEVKPWYPHRLLCKRFGVRDPHPDGPPTTGTKTWEEEVGVAPAAPASVDLADIETKPLDTTEDAEGEQDLGPRDLANVGLGDDPHQGVDTLTYVRPAMDVFKSIFASDEEESDEEADTESTITRPEAPISALDAALASVRRAAPPSIPAKAEEGLEAPVDLATFKPVFNLRTKSKDKEDKKSKDRKSKKDKGKRVALSFDVDEGGDTEDAPSSKGKRRERDGEAVRKPKKPRTQNEEDEWVEKPPPAAIASVGTGPTTTHPDTSGVPSILAEGTNSSRTRKRAVDFM